MSCFSLRCPSGVGWRASVGSALPGGPGESVGERPGPEVVLQAADEVGDTERLGQEEDDDEDAEQDVVERRDAHVLTGQEAERTAVTVDHLWKPDDHDRPDDRAVDGPQPP